MSRQSNAALRSQRRTPVILFSSVLLAHSCWIWAQAVIVDLFLLNPCCDSGSILFASRWSVICSQTIISRSLEAAGKQETGLYFSTKVAFPFFSTSVTNASFQFVGKTPSVIDWLMIFVFEIVGKFWGGSVRPNPEGRIIKNQTAKPEGGIWP